MAELEFERPLLELERRIKDLKGAAVESTEFAAEISRLEQRARRLQREIFAALSPWQKVQLCRHADRPYTLDYLRLGFEDWIELHGDRAYADDKAIVGGFARLGGMSLMVIGHQKGRGTRENMLRNFGMPNPEGYRKARRLMELADRFRRPVLTLIDTPGAYPGIGAEERGQSEAIGQCLLTMSRLGVPIVALIIGEGGSGGALALGVANRVLMLEFSTYSVISPEGCASILWKDGSRGADAANELKITAQDLARFGIVDEIVQEPAGGAHRDHDDAARRVCLAIAAQFEALAPLSPDELRADRYEKFRKIGIVAERTEPLATAQPSR